MNVLNRVTLQTLRRNRTRTVATIVGIVLSTALICAITTFASSMLNYARESVIYDEGDWHGLEQDCTYDRFRGIADEPRTASAVGAFRMGYAYVNEANGFAGASVNADKPYVCVQAVSAFDGSIPVHLTQGALPASSGEILLPEHLAKNGKVAANVGDVLALQLGERVDIEARTGLPAGRNLGQSSPFRGFPDGVNAANGTNGAQDEDGLAEMLEVGGAARSFTVVGFYERPDWRTEPYEAPGYTALTLADDGVDVSPLICNVYYKMNTPGDIYDFYQDMGCSGERNSRLLVLQGESSHDSIIVTLASLCALVILLVVLGSIALIYNAFSISVAERTRQFGLLASVGASRRQLRRTVLFEAAAVSAVGIPVGVVVGIAGIGVTLALIGDRFRAIGTSLDAHLYVAPWAVVLAVAIALVTVLVSAWIPSRRASRVTPIQAIRQTTDVTAGKGRRANDAAGQAGASPAGEGEKDIRVSKLTWRLFGMAGLLAKKYYKRSKRKYRATIASLAMSIVLFVSAAAFTGYITKDVVGVTGASAYDLSVAYYDSAEAVAEGVPSAQEMLAQMRALPEVTGVQQIRSTSMLEGGIAWEDLSNAVREDPEAYNFGSAELSGVGWVYMGTTFLDDDSFCAWLREAGLREADYFDAAHPRAVAVDGRMVWNSKAERYERLRILDDGIAAVQGRTGAERDGWDYLCVIDGEDGRQYVRYGRLLDADRTEYADVPAAEALVSFNWEIGAVTNVVPMFMGSRLGDAVQLVYPMSVMPQVLESAGVHSDLAADFYLQTTSHVAAAEQVNKLLAQCGIDEEVFDLAAGEESDRNLVSIVNVFAYGFVTLLALIAVTNVFNTVTTNVGLRRRDFAMLQSVGMESAGFRRMMLYECLQYGLRALCIGLPVACLFSAGIALAMNASVDTGFWLPWGAIAAAVIGTFAIVGATLLFALRKVRAGSVAEALR